MKYILQLIIISFSFIAAYSQIPRYIELNPWGLESQDGIVSVDFSDFNHDGFLDIVVAKKNSTYLQIAIKYFENSLGSYGEVFDMPDKLFTFTDFEDVAYIDASDIDYDGDIDVLVVGQNGFSTSSVVRVLSNNSVSNPSFTMMELSTVSSPFVLGYPSSVNINGDTLVDYAICNVLGKVDWYINQGNFEFQKLPTPIGIDSLFNSLTSLTQVDINNRDVSTFMSFNIETGFNTHSGSSLAKDSNHISTFIDPGIGTNYFYEMRFHDFDNNTNTDLFLVAYSSELGRGYVTKFYFIKDIQECIDVIYLTSDDSPLSHLYKARSEIIIQDTVSTSDFSSSILSAPLITLEGTLLVNEFNPTQVDSVGCISRF